jgi:hypothetical protein
MNGHHLWEHDSFGLAIIPNITLDNVHNFVLSWMDVIKQRHWSVIHKPACFIHAHWFNNCFVLVVSLDETICECDFGWEEELPLNEAKSDE